MKKRVAVYAGSFDPFTLGHLDIAIRGASLVDTLIIAIGNNPAKNYALSYEERIEIIQDACQKISNFEIKLFHGLLVDFCQEIGANIILRGIRSEKDLSFETPIALANKKLAPEVETIFLLANPELQFVSSSLAKEVAVHNGNISYFLTPLAERKIKQKRKER